RAWVARGCSRAEPMVKTCETIRGCLVGAAVNEERGWAMLAMSMHEERQVAQSLSPTIAWPTLRLALLLPLAQGALIAGALTGWFPLWTVILPLGYIHFVYYSLVD